MRPNPPNPPQRPAAADPAVDWLAANYPLLVAVARRTLRRRGAPPAAAEDVAQAAAVAIWRHWAECRDDPTERRTWAAHVARNAARDRAAWCRRRPAAPFSAVRERGVIGSRLYAGRVDLGNALDYAGQERGS